MGDRLVSLVPTFVSVQTFSELHHGAVMMARGQAADRVRRPWVEAEEGRAQRRLASPVLEDEAACKRSAFMIPRKGARALDLKTARLEFQRYLQLPLFCFGFPSPNGLLLV